MLRYFALYGYFVRFSISKAAEFRIDFFFRIIMDLVYYAVNVAFYKIIFLRTAHLGGWNQDQTLIFLGGYLVVNAVAMTVFANNMAWLPHAVNRGDLDYYLVRPVSSLFFLSLRDFAASSFLNLLFSVGILAWAMARAPGAWSAASLPLFILMLAGGAFLHYLLHLVFVIPVFWLHSGSTTQKLFYSFVGFMERPDRIYFGWTRKVLLTILPFCLIVSFPARIFLEGFRWTTFLHFAVIVAGLFFSVVMAWKWGLRAYSSASS